MSGDEVMGPSVWIAMPCYSRIEPGFHESTLQLQVHLIRLGIRHIFKWLPGESLIERARNRMVQDFLDDGTYTHFLFLDVDLIFTPTTVIRLLTSGHELVGACYAKKAIGHGLVGNPDYASVEAVEGDASKARVSLPPIRDGFARAKEIGTGCMMIAKTALEKIIAAKREDGSPVLVRYSCDLTPGRKIYPFFQSGPEDARSESARFLSEDFWVCRLWQELAGGEVWMDTKTSVKHVGAHIYSAPSLERQWADGK